MSGDYWAQHMRVIAHLEYQNVEKRINESPLTDAQIKDFWNRFASRVTATAKSSPNE